jgi:hypothetical protein
MADCCGPGTTVPRLVQLNAPLDPVDPSSLLLVLLKEVLL